MNIEITDRELWKQKCEQAIAGIKAYREEQDNEYIQNWRNSRFKIFSRKGRYPRASDGVRFVYPSIAAWGNLQAAKDLLYLINSQGTGTIAIDEDDLRMITDWSD